MKYDERYRGTPVLKYELENGRIGYIYPLKDGLTREKIQRELEDMTRLCDLKLNS